MVGIQTSEREFCQTGTEIIGQGTELHHAALADKELQELASWRAFILQQRVPE